MPGMAIRNWLREVDARRPADMARRFSGACRTLPACDCRRTENAPSTARWSGCAATCASTTMRRCTTPCAAARQVWCVFVFDRDILDPLPRADRRVEFIRDSLVGVDAAARAGGLARHRRRRPDRAPRPARATRSRRWPRALDVQAVYANHDDEPAALARDAARARPRWRTPGVALHTFKDHVVFERGEVLTQARQRLQVFTPYKNAWLKQCDALLPEGLSGGRATPAALAPRPAGERRRADAGGARLRAAPTCTQLRLPSGPAGGARTAATTSWRASTATTRRATSPPSRARAT